jgi:FkbM family methyltransferase
MGKRVEKLREINTLADRLELSFANRCRLLLSNYLKRARTRLPFLPQLHLRIFFTFEGRAVTVVIRSNEVDYRLLAGVFVNREYEMPVANPHRILDLGGNIGTASVFFHAMHPEAEIIAVEALPANLPILRENFEVNRIPGRVIGAAISDQPGKTTFFLGEADCSSVVRQPWMSGDAIEVDCVTVPEIMRQAGWDNIDFLKVDVEGAEKAVFRNCGEWIGKVGAIVGELHDGYTIRDFDRDTQGRFDCSEVFEYGPHGELKGVLAVRKAMAGPIAT